MSDIDRWEPHDSDAVVDHATSGVPEEPDQLEAWDRANTLLTKEWATFWERVRDKERDFKRKRGEDFGGLRRAMLVREFSKRLIATYGASDVNPAWQAWNDKRQMEKGRVAR